MYKKISLLLLSFNILMATPNNGATPDINYSESFLDALDEATDIATRTKLNIDDVPAFVSILRNDELEKYGFDNLYEALSIIPGVELSIESSGARQVIFRGVKEKGKVKLLIDNVSVNNSYRGSVYSFLDFPIELIERIEVIRGPGAVIYGSNAMSGVINVVTKTNKKLFLSYGSYGAKKGGFSTTYNTDKYKLSFNGYYQDNNKGIDTKADKSGNRGKSNEEFDDYSVGLKVKSDNVTFTSRVKKSVYGSAFGLSNYIEKPNDRKGYENKSLFSKVTYQDDITKDIHYNVSFGYDNYTQNIDVRALPHPLNDDDLIMHSSYKEKKYYTNFELFLNSFKNQEIVVGVGYEKNKPTKNRFHSYFESTPNTQYIPTSSLLKSGMSREISSFYLNDTVSINDSMDASLGVRVDKYSDFGNAFSPRATLVYKYNEKLNYKVMYSKAFRAPSFVELYANIPGISVGNNSLDKEESNTIEAGIIYDLTHSNTLKVNIYNTKIDNIIYRDANKKYIQDGYQKFTGIESEFIAKLSNNSQLDLTLSYINAKDEDDNNVANIANILGNIKYSNRFSNGITSGTVFKYVSKRKRVAADTRKDLASYNTVDQSFSYKYKNYTTVLSIKNIFNNGIYYPADVNTYQNDYPREGRTYSIKFTMDF